MTSSPQQLSDPLDRVDFFRALDAGERKALSDAAQRYRYATGETISVEGQPAGDFFVVLSGRVKIMKTSPAGREQVLRYVGAGGSFNEVPAFDGGPIPATATAAEPTELLIVSRSLLYRLIAESPEFAVAVVRSFAGRLRHMVELVEDLSFRGVSARVARVILQSIAPHAGIGAGAGRSDHLTQREIAEMAGTSREVVARALRTLESIGAIEAHRGEIRVLDAERLAALAEGA